MVIFPVGLVSPLHPSLFVFGHSHSGLILQLREKAILSPLFAPYDTAACTDLKIAQARKSITVKLQFEFGFVSKSVYVLIHYAQDGCFTSLCAIQLHYT